MGAEPKSTDVSAFRAKKPETTRLCALSRVQRPVEDLIRFVAAPDGSIVADLRQNLPGRGVWITAERASIAKACAEKSFDRSFKHATPRNDSLAEQVEALLVKRACDALSLANKAGALMNGFTKVEQAIRKDGVSVLIHASDAAPDGCNKLTRKFLAISQKSDPERRILRILTTSQLSLAIGRLNVVHAGLAESGATKKFLFEARRLERYGMGFAAVEAASGHLIGNE